MEVRQARLPHWLCNPPRNVHPGQTATKPRISQHRTLQVPLRFQPLPIPQPQTRLREPRHLQQSRRRQVQQKDQCLCLKIVAGGGQLQSQRGQYFEHGIYV